ncbi:MAG: hypothetical protein JWM36_3194 [Hyphomicrobiales bacterium]|nr:hypothetical protein [Hyphomicrobiales bacterium]
MRRIHDREKILDAWSKGLPTAEICAECNVQPRTLYSFVQVARDRGDPRGTSRIGAQPPRRGKQCHDHEAILALHAKYPELTLSGIGERIGCNANYVRSVIHSARRKETSEPFAYPYEPAAALRPPELQPLRPHSGEQHDVVVRKGVSLPRLRCLEHAISLSAG